MGIHRLLRPTRHWLQEVRKQTGEVMLQRREPIEGVEQKRYCLVVRVVGDGSCFAECPYSYWVWRE